MGKKTSIFVTCLVTLLIAFLCVISFVSYSFKSSVWDYNSVLKTIEAGVDIKGGVAYDLELKNDVSAEDKDLNIDEVLETIENRVYALGYRDYRITAYTTDKEENSELKIRIEFEERDSNDADIAVICAYGEIEVKDGDGNLLLEDEEVISGAKYLGETVSGGTSYYSFEIKFTKSGMEALENAVKKAEDSFTLNITLGDETLYSEEISEDFIKSNMDGRKLTLYSQSEAVAMQQALQINTGGLGQEYEAGVLKTSTPILGEKAALRTVWVVAGTFILSLVALLVFYRGLGLAADMTLTLSTLLELLILISVDGAVVNFGGVIGLAAAIVLSVITMVTVFESVKKEFSRGKTIKFAISSAYKGTMFSLIDIHLVLGVFAVLGIALGRSVVKSFAITFGIGVVLSALFSIFFSWFMVKTLQVLAKGKGAKNSEAGFFGLKREEV